MSAETLRRAAALIRERAEAATPSPWLADVRGDGRAWVFIYDEMDSLSLHGYPSDAEHIASWHPTVALAVADWLDKEAGEFELLAAQSLAVNLLIRTADNADDIDAQISLGYHTLAEALAVARAYLGVTR